MAVPLVDGNERVDLWHPVVYARWDALCADPRMKGQLKVESAVRTYREQEQLHDAFENGSGVLAADPDGWLAPAYGLIVVRGSWHMQQRDGFGYAGDAKTSALTPDVYALLPAVAAEYRLIQSVTNRGFVPPWSPPPPLPATVTPAGWVREWWHLQPPLNEGPLVWVPEEDEMTDDQMRELKTYIRSQVREEGARIEGALTAEVNASEDRTLAAAKKIIDRLPEKRSWFDGMAGYSRDLVARAKAVQAKLGIPAE